MDTKLVFIQKRPITKVRHIVLQLQYYNSKEV